jgi:hypothetical protein
MLGGTRTRHEGASRTVLARAGTRHDRVPRAAQDRTRTAAQIWTAMARAGARTDVRTALRVRGSARTGSRISSIPNFICSHDEILTFAAIHKAGD